MQTALILILSMSLLTAIVFAVDKYLAKNDMWRIPEAVLLFLSAAGGSMGGIISMCLCNHKTQKPTFYKGLPTMLVIQTALFVIISNIFLY